MVKLNIFPIPVSELFGFRLLAEHFVPPAQANGRVVGHEVVPLIAFVKKYGHVVYCYTSLTFSFLSVKSWCQGGAGDNDVVNGAQCSMDGTEGQIKGNSEPHDLL